MKLLRQRSSFRSLASVPKVPPPTRAANLRRALDREFNGPPLQMSRKSQPMEVTPTAFGTWNGGRFMNYGQPLDDAQWIALVRHAWDQASALS